MPIKQYGELVKLSLDFNHKPSLSVLLLNAVLTARGFISLTFPIVRPTGAVCIICDSVCNVCRHLTPVRPIYLNFTMITVIYQEFEN